MNVIPGIPFRAKSVTTAAAMVVDAGGEGGDGIHYFEVVPIVSKKADDTYDEIAVSIEDTQNNRWQCRNTFTDEMPIGEKLMVVIDEIGICNILVWPCGEDE